MLTLIPVYNTHEKSQLFQNHFGEGMLWVVATSEAKRRLQLQCIQESEIISTQNVLRATEYWSTLFQTNCPEKQQISDSLIYVLLENWYRTAQVDVEFQDIQRFKTYCDQIFPILVAPEKRLFFDWIREDEAREHRLLGWTRTAENFLNYLSQKNFVGNSWMMSSLLQEKEIYFGPYEKYVFDLGNEIQPEEVQVILRLSETFDVTVIAPTADYLQSYRAGRCYQKLDAEYVNLQRTDVSADKLSLRSGSVLAEVKTVTAYVRRVLDGGVAPDKIAIACAEPEKYWDMLKGHLDVEGIPIDKSVVAKVIGLPYFHEWLSRIKVLIQMYSSGDLESFLNSKNYFSKNKEAYFEFKKNFSYLYNLEAAESLLEGTKIYRSDKVISFADFISFLYATWTHPDFKLYNKLVDALIKDFRGPLQFSMVEWHAYLSLVLSRLETHLESGDHGGVAFAGPHQLDHLQYSHLIVLGCHRGAMQVINNTPFVPEDVSRLENDLGYYLPPCEDKKMEYDILWSASAPETKVLLSYAETDFNGDPCVVSQLWLGWNQNAEVHSVHETSRWDKIMKQALVEAPLATKTPDAAQIQYKLKRENSKESWKNLELSYQGRLSVSAFEKYHNCAFTFFTTRVLKQNELKELDLEIDPLFQGSFLHKILEHVLVKYKNLDISERELEALYHEVLESQEMAQDIRPDVLHYWKREKHRHLLMIRKFLVEERAWRVRLPNIHVDSLETAMSGFVGTENETLSFSKEAKPGFFSFAAKIDRIDRDEKGNLAVYDYKTSKPGDFKSFEKWPETFQIQMPLYAMGLESGLSDPHIGAQVVSAGYIFLRDGSRGSGFVLQGIEHGFQAATTPKSKQNISVDEKDAVFLDLRLQLKEMIENIQKGQFAPVPLDEKDCPTCHWRKACRAPHLK